MNKEIRLIRPDGNPQDKDIELATKFVKTFTPILQQHALRDLVDMLAKTRKDGFDYGLCHAMVHANDHKKPRKKRRWFKKPSQLKGGEVSK